MAKSYFSNRRLSLTFILFLFFSCIVSVQGQTTTDTFDTTTPGTGTWTIPIGVTEVTVEVWGGGGAGGGSNSNNNGGSGGGAGGYSMKVFSGLTPGTFTYTIGAGGTGVTGDTGNSGFPSSATHVASGVTITGNGGIAGMKNKGIAGIGGTATNGDVNVTGGAGGVGGTGINGSRAGGDGGNAHLGGTGGEGRENNDGLAGNDYGAGGGGGERDGGTSKKGGNGGSGAVSFSYATPVVSFSGNTTIIADGDVTPDALDLTSFETLNLRQYDILNSTAADVTIDSIVLSGADAAEFSVEDFTAGTVVAASGGTDFFRVLFSPSGACADSTVKNATVTITYDGGTTHTFDIQATCFSATTSVTGNTNPIANGALLADISTSNNTDFGNVPMNFTETKTFSIENTGTVPLSVTSVALSGGAEFTMVSGAGAATINGNSTGTFSIAYDPDGLASHNTTVTITSTIGTHSFVIAGTGIDNVLVPGCLGDPGACNELNDTSFDAAFTGWTVSGWTSTVENGYNAATFTEKNGANGPGVHASMSQNLSGLDASSSVLLVKFKVKVKVQPCNATGRSFDLNVSFGGTTYLTMTLLDTDLDATLTLQNGGILVATNLTEIRTWFTAAGCDNTNRVDDFTEVYLSIPKAAATSGDLEFTIEDTGTTGTTQFHQMDVLMGEVTATDNGGACGFGWFNASNVAEAHGAAVSTWTDDGSGNNATNAGAASSQPVMEFAAGNHFNFNPSVSFDGGDHLMGDAGYSSAAQFVVFKHTGVTSGSSSMTLIGTRATDSDDDRSGLKLGAFSGSITNESYGVLRGTSAAGYAVGGRTGTILNGILYSTLESVVAPTIPSTWEVTRNGVEDSRVAGGAGYQNWANSDFVLGASPNVSDYSTFDDYYTGQIAEVLTYASILSSTESQKIQTYLAIKYGITIDMDYVSGAGTTIYDVTDYNNRIFGIGRESCQGLHQRQSKSQDDSDTAEIMLTIGYNSLVGDTNSSTTGNDLPDDTFVVIGDDDADRTAWTISADTAADAPVSFLVESERITREFKMQVTGAPASAIRMYVDGSKLPAIAATERIALVIADASGDIKNATFEDATDKILPMTEITDATSSYLNHFAVDVDVSGYSTAYFTFIKYDDCFTELICSGTTTTWNGSSWDNGVPDITTPVVLSGDYDTGDDGGGFNCCTLNLTTGSLTIDDGDLVSVQSDITNNTSITIADNADLMQYYDYAENTGTGTFSITRESNGMYLGDYTYWSAPVSGYNLSNIPKNRAYYWSPAIGNWAAASGVMEEGLGYIVMTDNSSKVTPTKTTPVFTGPINNGRVIKNVLTTNSTFNLLGNPYPGALDADEFLTWNTGTGVTTGGVYFWTHNTRISEFNASGLKGDFVESDYAVYTLAGGVGTAALSTTVDETDGDGLDISYGGNAAAPTQYIGAGQGFFVEAQIDGEVTFKNCMRATTGGNNSNFYRSAAEKSEKDRFWLDVTNEKGSYKQMLVGYFEGASDGMDHLYDAKIVNGTNQLELYSIVKDEKSDENINLTIQGKGDSYTDDEVIPIGFRRKSEAPEKSKISLYKYEGLFKDKIIYLEDKLANTTHDLKKGPYTFESSVESVEDRFVIRFEGVPEPVEEVVTYGVFVSSGDNGITVKTDQSNISDIKIYNLLGALVYHKTGTDVNFVQVSNFKPTNSVYIVVVQLANGGTSTTKVIY